MTPEPFFLSYAVPGADNELLLGLTHLWHAQVNIAGYPKKNVRVHVFRRVTLTLKGTNLLVYWDGELFTKKQVQRKALRTGGSWVLSQEQDAVGGKFDPNQRLVGKICNFRMWSFGMDEEEATSFFQDPYPSKAQAVFDNPPTYRFEKMNGAY